MQLPTQSAAYERRVEYGRYVARRLRRRKLKDLQAAVVDATAAVKQAGLAKAEAEYELQDLFVNPLDDRVDPRRDKSFEVEERLFSLGFWSKRFFSATVDQFLSFMQYSYGSMVMLPVLSKSVIVIDEVHSF